MDAVIFILFVGFGLVMGSFAGATVWRIRARQLVSDKKDGYEVDSRELKSLKPLTKASLSDDRSRCLHCQHPLEWYDLVPLLSWLSTRGKCRYCQKFIGWFEPTIELGTAVLFGLFYGAYVMSAAHTAVAISLIILLMTSIVMLVILFAYDQKWFLLPNVVVFPLIGVSVCVAGLQLISAADKSVFLINAVGGVAILSGLYFIIYEYSKWRFGEDKTWVGFGDVKLGIALGLLLGSWQLSFLALFLANILGIIAVLPGLVTKKVAMNSQVPLGPLLIIGFFITFFYGENLLALYQAFSVHLSDFLLSLML